MYTGVVLQEPNRTYNCLLQNCWAYSVYSLVAADRDAYDDDQNKEATTGATYDVHIPQDQLTLIGHLQNGEKLR